MKVIYVDIDETICRREKSTDFGVVHDYKKAKPIKENIEKINKLNDEGHTIVYWTARGSKSGIDWAFALKITAQVARDSTSSLDDLHHSNST